MSPSNKALVESALAFLKAHIALVGLLNAYEQKGDVPDEDQINVHLEVLRKERVGAATFLIQHGRYATEKAECIVAELCAEWEQCAATPWGYLDLADKRRSFHELAAPFATTLNLYEMLAPAEPIANPPEVPVSGAESEESEGPAELHAGMTWQEAAERMESLRKQGEPWTSQHKMASQFGCSSRTINKAIRGTPELQNWAKRRTATPKAQSLNDVVTDRTAQSRELDPADDAAIREFIEAADPEVKAWFLSLPSETQLEVINDPDKHQRVLGRKP